MNYAVINMHVYQNIRMLFTHAQNQHYMSKHVRTIEKYVK